MGCDIVITLEISSSHNNLRELISIGYKALKISVRLAFGMGRQSGDFRASAIAEGITAMLEAVARLGIAKGLGRDSSFLLPTLPVARYPFFLLQHWPQPA
jgi:hypothetical protein